MKEKQVIVVSMGQVCAAWNNHPLAIEILIALCNYIEGKAKKKTEEADHV